MPTNRQVKTDESTNEPPKTAFPTAERFDVATTQIRLVAALAFVGFLATAAFCVGGRAYRTPETTRPFASKIESERSTAARTLADAVASLAPTSREREIVETSVKTATDAPPSETLVFLVDINSAKKSELLNLPRIGDQLADRILEYRDANGGFRSVDELLEISGIGEKTLARLRPLCVAGPLPEPEETTPKTNANSL